MLFIWVYYFIDHILNYGLAAYFLFFLYIYIYIYDRIITYGIHSMIIDISDYCHQVKIPISFFVLAGFES